MLWPISGDDCDRPATGSRPKACEAMAKLGRALAVGLVARSRIRASTEHDASSVCCLGPLFALLGIGGAGVLVKQHPAPALWAPAEKAPSRLGELAPRRSPDRE